MTLAAELRAHARELLAAADRAEALQAELDQAQAQRMQPAADVLEPYLNTTQAARLLRLSERAIRDQAQNGELPGAKHGRGWRFDRRAIQAWHDDRVRRGAIRAA